MGPPPTNDPLFEFCMLLLSGEVCDPIGIIWVWFVAAMRNLTRGLKDSTDKKTFIFPTLRLMKEFCSSGFTGYSFSLKFSDDSSICVRERVN